MTAPRDGWWEKWARGEEHCNLLDNEILETFANEENRVRVVTEPGTEAGRYLLRVTALHTAPTMRWALIIGDCVHNFRAALDHLAWRLALIHNRGRNPQHANKIVFPIYDKPRKFRDAEIRSDFERFHWAIFEEFQPYQGIRGADSWSGKYIPQLALLKQLTNRDKHQHLTPVLLPPSHYYFPREALADPANAEWPYWDPMGMTMIPEPLELDTVVMAVRVTNPRNQPKVGVESTVAPIVSLPRYGPVIPALARIAEFVRRVLREFDPLV